MAAQLSQSGATFESISVKFHRFRLLVVVVTSIAVCLTTFQAQDCECREHRSKRQIASWLPATSHGDPTQPVTLDHGEDDLQNNHLARELEDSSRQSRALDQLMAPYNPFSFHPQAASAKQAVQTNANLQQGQQQRDLNQYKTVYACEGNKLELSCANEGKLIHLVRATYGRFSLSMCNEHGLPNLSVQCVQFRAFLIMQPICNGSANCSVIASKELFGDPCEGTPKYLEVQYYCDEPQQRHHHSSSNNNNGPSSSNKPGGKSQASSEHSANNGAAATPFSQATSQHLHQNHIATQEPVAHTNVVASSSASLASRGPTGCGSQLSVRSLSWNVTRAGSFGRQACPEGSSGQALWLCDARKLQFTPSSGPDFSQCRTIWLAKLASQLEQTQSSNANNQHHLESILRLQAPAYLSLLADLRLLAQARQLFGEDLKIINVMLGQMATSIKQAVVNPQINLNSGPSQLAASQFERLFQRSLELTSSLFEPMQRLAWLELASPSEIRSLEAQILGHLRLFGTLMGASLPPVNTNHYSSSQGLLNGAPAELSWREKNLQARLVTLPQQQLAVIQQQQINSIQAADQQSIDQNYVRIGAASDELHQQQFGSDALEFTELKLHASVLKQLASDTSNLNGASRILVIDVRKADYGLLKQQQLLAVDSIPAVELSTPSQAASAPTAEPQQRVIAAASSLDQIKLAELLAQWPVSFQFKQSSGQQQQQNFCSSSMNSDSDSSADSNSPAQEKCQTIRSSPLKVDPFSSGASSATAPAMLACRCEQLGFVTVSTSPSPSDIPIEDAASSLVGFRQRSQSSDSISSWPRSELPIDNSYGFGAQPISGGAVADTTTLISSSSGSNQQQPKSINPQSTVSQTLFSGMAFGLGITLLLLTMIGLFVGLTRLTSQSRLLVSKQATYLGSGSTTDPQLEHSLISGCCPIVTSASHPSGPTTTSTTTPGATATAPMSPYQFHYHSAQYQQQHQQSGASHLLGHKDLSTLASRHQQQHQQQLNYGAGLPPLIGGGFVNSMRVGGGSPSRWLPSWLSLQKPTGWFKLNRQNQPPHHHLASHHIGNHYDQHISPLHSNIIQHQQATLPQVLHQQHQRGNLINVGPYGTTTPNKSNHNHFSHHQQQNNGYATSNQHHNPQLIAALNAGSSNSTSSYVSSSAYYEEIGQPGSGSSIMHQSSGGSSSNSGGNPKHQHGIATTPSSSSTSQLIPSHPTHHQRTIVDPFKGPNNIIITSNNNNLSHNQNHNNYL